MQHQSTSTAQRNARALRATMTDAERKSKLIVEIDGSQHQEQASYDARRERFFRDQGFAVLRFPSNAPLNNLDAVRETILDELKVLALRAPTPTLPQRGRE